MPEHYYDEIEHELVVSCEFDSDDGDCEDNLNPEDLHDWNSEELLNLWMSIVEYHEDWYLPLNRTFHQFCEFALFFSEKEERDKSEPLDKSVDLDFSPPPPEIQAIDQNHPLIKNRDWNYFFSLSYK